MPRSKKSKGTLIAYSLLSVPKPFELDNSMKKKLSELKKNIEILKQLKAQREAQEVLQQQ